MNTTRKTFFNRATWGPLLLPITLVGCILYASYNWKNLYYWVTHRGTPPSKKIVLLIDKTEAYPLSSSFINKELELKFKQLRDDQWNVDSRTKDPLNVDLTYKVLLPGANGEASKLIEEGFRLHPGIGSTTWFTDTTKNVAGQQIEFAGYKRSLKGKYERFEEDIKLDNHPGGFAQESRILDEIDKVTLSSNWTDSKVDTLFIIVSDLLECSPRPSGIPDFETLNTDERVKAFEATGRIRPDFDPDRHQLIIFHIVKDGAPGSPIVNPFEFWTWYFSKNAKNKAYPSGAIRYYPINLNGRVSR